jgi:hypothetical protein
MKSGLPMVHPDEGANFSGNFYVNLSDHGIIPV